MTRFHATLLVLLLALLPCSVSRAHDGLENETEIRVRKDRVEVTLRSSLVFAWKLLGEKAPPDLSEASLEKARAALKESAKDLIEMTSGTSPLKLRSFDCVFELEQHVAFTYVFEPPAGNPEIRFKARFLKSMGELEEGTFRLIDLTRDPRRRDVEPLARKRLHRVDDSFAFVIAPEGVRVVPEKKSAPSPPSR